jgi:type IV secretory pathway TrbL component
MREKLLVLIVILIITLLLFSCQVYAGPSTDYLQSKESAALILEQMMYGALPYIFYSEGPR